MKLWRVGVALGTVAAVLASSVPRAYSFTTPTPYTGQLGTAGQILASTPAEGAAAGAAEPVIAITGDSTIIAAAAPVALVLLLATLMPTDVAPGQGCPVAGYAQSCIDADCASVINSNGGYPMWSSEWFANAQDSTHQPLCGVPEMARLYKGSTIAAQAWQVRFCAYYLVWSGDVFGTDAWTQAACPAALQARFYTSVPNVTSGPIPSQVAYTGTALCSAPFSAGSAGSCSSSGLTGTSSSSLAEVVDIAVSNPNYGVRMTVTSASMNTSGYFAVEGFNVLHGCCSGSFMAYPVAMVSGSFVYRDGTSTTQKTYGTSLPLPMHVSVLSGFSNGSCFQGLYEATALYNSCSTSMGNNGIASFTHLHLVIQAGASSSSIVISEIDLIPVYGLPSGTACCNPNPAVYGTTTIAPEPATVTAPATSAAPGTITTIPAPGTIPTPTTQATGASTNNDFLHLGDTITSALSSGLNKVVSGITSIETVVGQGLQSTLNWGFNAVVGAVNGVTSGVAQLSTVTQDGFQFLANTFVTAVAPVVGAIGSMQDVVGGILRAQLAVLLDVRTAVQTVATWTATALSVTVSNPSAIYAPVVTAVNAVATALAGTLDVLVTNASAIYSPIVTAVAAVTAALVAGITVTVTGFITGIESALEYEFVPSTSWLTAEETTITTSVNSSPPGVLIGTLTAGTTALYTAVSSGVSGSQCGPTLGFSGFTPAHGPSMPGFSVQLPSPSPCPGSGVGGARTSADDDASGLFGYRQLVRDLLSFALVWAVMWGLVNDLAPWARKSKEVSPA